MRLMSRLILLTTLLASLSAAPVFAQETEVKMLRLKVERLEKRVEELEKIIRNLEQQISGSPAAAHKHSSSAEAWKNRQNWRRLRKGMSKTEVTQILGVPGKIDMGSILEFWHYDYPRGGSVNFNNRGTVNGWDEP